jgi:hypothetical protein
MLFIMESTPVNIYLHRNWNVDWAEINTDDQNELVMLELTFHKQFELVIYPASCYAQ